MDCPGIISTPGVNGGEPSVIRTRIPVWLPVQARRLGASDADISRSYPNLYAEDIVNAWDYYHRHSAEIDAQIAHNEAAEADLAIYAYFIAQRHTRVSFRYGDWRNCRRHIPSRYVPHLARSPRPQYSPSQKLNSHHSALDTPCASATMAEVLQLVLPKV